MRSVKYTGLGMIFAVLAVNAMASTRDTLTSSRTKLPKGKNVEVGVPYDQPDRELDGTNSPRPTLRKERNVDVGVPYDQPDREVDRNKVGDKNLYRRAQKREKTESDLPSDGGSDLIGVE